MEWGCEAAIRRLALPSPACRPLTNLDVAQVGEALPHPKPGSWVNRAAVEEGLADLSWLQVGAVGERLRGGVGSAWAPGPWRDTGPALRPSQCRTMEGSKSGLDSKPGDTMSRDWQTGGSQARERAWRAPRPGITQVSSGTLQGAEVAPQRYPESGPSRKPLGRLCPVPGCSCWSTRGG